MTLSRMDAQTLPPPAGARPQKQTTSDADSLRLAAIDIGSNSIHMIVAQIDADGGATTLWRMKESTGLGRLSFPSHRINAEAMDRALSTLARFEQAARAKSAEKIIAVATSAVREATNGGDLIERARRELKLQIHVVGAKEEARLIYLGVRHAGGFGGAPDEPHLAIDVGGGSVELIVGTNERAMLLESRKLGAARMTAKFIKSDPPTKDEIERLRGHYQKELAPLFEQIAKTKPVAAVGTSGTLENIARLCGADGSGNGKPAAPAIDAKRLDKLAARLVKLTAAERAALEGLDEGRQDQIVAGVVLVQVLLAKLDELGLQKLTVSNAALREGIVLDYIARKLPAMRVRREVPDPRRRSVLDLCRRCEWHREHSQQVTRLTLMLFDELVPLHELKPRERELIEYAALMHDIGWHIGRRDHHKHSAYLILHGKLRDFSPREIRIMANIARYHRGPSPKQKHRLYAMLPGAARRTVDFGAAILRIADGLDRSHAAVVRSLRCAIRPEKVLVSLETRGDAELEVWGAQRKAGLFEKAFDRSVAFEKHDGAASRT